MAEQKKIEDSFKSLKPLEHIRTRSGMYVGTNVNPMLYSVSALITLSTSV